MSGTATQYMGGTITHFDPRDRLEWRKGSGNTIEIYDIQVMTKRRDGIGRYLVYELLRLIPKDVNLVWAITRTDNLIAQQFYESLGFRVVAILRNFYSHDGSKADAVMFGRDI